MNSSNDILNAILSSRRLLSDHVGVLQMVKGKEDAAIQETKAMPNGGTLIKSALLATASVGALLSCLRNVQNLSMSIVVGLSSTASSVYFIRQLRSQMEHRKQVQNIEYLIHTIDAFDVALRQKIRFFREAQCLIGTADAASQQRQDRLSADANATMTAVMPVIWATYAAIQRLEMLPLSDEYADVYLPTEPLDNCELLQRSEYTVQNIREMQEIFQFLQSQLLVRLGLASVYNAAQAVTFVAYDVPLLCSSIETQLQVCTEQQRNIAQRKKVQRKLEAIRQAHPIEAAASSTTVLKHSSLDVLARLLALTDEIAFIDTAIQAASDIQDERLISIGGQMERLGERMEACRDEYQRMVCIYNRAVHGRQQPIVIPATENEKTETAQAVRFFDDNTPLVPEAEFYALLNNDANHLDESVKNDGAETDAALSLEAELQELSAKVVKRQFRPVLRQLKDRLEPINEAMRARERKFYAEKGIEVSDNDVDQCPIRTMDDDNDVRPERKDQYADMRNFLEGKQQMSFLPLKGFPVRHMTIEEDILE